MLAAFPCGLCLPRELLRLESKTEEVPAVQTNRRCLLYSARRPLLGLNLHQSRKCHRAEFPTGLPNSEMAQGQVMQSVSKTGEKSQEQTGCIESPATEQAGTSKDRCRSHREAKPV